MSDKFKVSKKINFDLNKSDELNVSMDSSGFECDMDICSIEEEQLSNSAVEPEAANLLTSPFLFQPKYLHSLGNARTPEPKSKPTVNVNPFTPNFLSKKRNPSGRSRMEPERIRPHNYFKSPEDQNKFAYDSYEEYPVPSNNRSLHEGNINRYHEEFHEICLLGSGEFGSVYKCLNRLDGCYYAIKKSIKPVDGRMNTQNALKEVYAHAVLGRHDYVVRYFSAWSEDYHLIIQNEYCNGGSLADAIEKNKTNNTPFSEVQLQTLLNHIIYGLKYIHSMDLVHMDIKPGNIFISIEPRFNSVNNESADDGFEENANSSTLDTECASSETITYKIGDLGHVTSILVPEVNEGDCRYLSYEILQDNYKNLSKADIFSLGLTVYEAAGGGPLPKNGQAWHDIRSGKLPILNQYSQQLNDLIKLMIDPDPERRPTAATLVNHPYLIPTDYKSKQQLLLELNKEKLKNELLTQRIQKASKFIQSFIRNSFPSKSSSPTILRNNKFFGKNSLRTLSNSRF